MGSKKPSVTNRIREFRFRAHEMTQEQLADLAGVTRQTIIALEANKYVPSLLLAFRIAAAFGVTIEEVFFFHGNGSAAPSRRN
jgi:putative transcriptional regulator